VRTYTFSEARQRLASVLDEATREGEVHIRRRDGRSFVVQPVVEDRSPLEVPAVSTSLTTAEVLALVREGRRPRRAGRKVLAARKDTTMRREKQPRTGSTSR
jgi:hypothetical protein